MIKLIILFFVDQSFAQEEQQVQEKQKKNLKIQKNINSSQKKEEEEIEEQKEKINSLVTVGLLGIYDFFDNQFGFEFRTYIEKDYMDIPIEWQFALGDNGYFRIRAWPSIYFIRRETLEQPSAFVSIYSETTIKKKQNNSSGAEFGLGGGFAGGGFSLAAWFSSNYYQGNPSVKDLLSFRTKVAINYSDFYAVIGFRIGAAIGKIKPQIPSLKELLKDNKDDKETGNDPIQNEIARRAKEEVEDKINKTINELEKEIKNRGPISTALTTADIDVEFGYAIYKTLTIILGAQLRTDNLSGLLDSAAKGEVSTDSKDIVNESLKLILKMGISYSF